MNPGYSLFSLFLGRGHTTRDVPPLAIFYRPVGARSSSEGAAGNSPGREPRVPVAPGESPEGAAHENKEAHGRRIFVGGKAPALCPGGPGLVIPRQAALLPSLQPSQPP